MSNNNTFLHDLWHIIQQKKQGDPTSSWTAKLYQADTEKVIQKFGEEAVETVIAAMQTQNAANTANTASREELVKESADCLYHLLVLWAKCGVDIDAVAQELHNRQQQSGLQEKANRSS